jgi:hypothetical protein
MRLLSGFGFVALFGGALSFFARDATLIEAVNATGSIYDALFAGVKWMAVRAQVHTNFRHGGMCFDDAVARRANNARRYVIGMDSFFHLFLYL